MAAAGPTLPDGWELRPLLEVAQINPRLGRRIADDRLPVTFVPMRAVAVEGGGVVEPETRPYGEVRKGYTAFLPGDVIMAKITPCMENGKIAVVPQFPNDVCFGSTEFHVIRPNKGVSSRWIYLFLLLNATRAEAKREMAGAVGQMRVPAEFLKILKIPVPPAVRQNLIIGMIDELFSDLDTGIANLISTRDNLIRYRMSLLRAAVSGQLTKKWREERSFVDKTILSSRFPSHGRSTADPRAKYPLPDGWRWDSLENISTVAAGNPAPQGRENFDSDGAPFVRVQDMGKLNSRIWMTRTRDCLTEDAARSLRLFPQGAVLFTKSGASTLLNQRAILSKPMHVVSHIAAALPEGEITSEWLYFCLSSVDFADYAHATTLPSVPLSKIRKIPIPVAPVAEQSRIVEEIGEQLDMLQSAYDAVTTRIEDAGKLRQTILGRAFTGQLNHRDRRRAEGRSRGERARRVRPRRTRTENPA